MPTKKMLSKRNINLSLSVQYATPEAELPRWRLRRWVQRSLAHLAGEVPANIDLTIRIVDQHEATALNKAYRHKNYAPNVLTFTYDEDRLPGQPLSGDIVICADVLKQQATEQDKRYLDHACHLVVHGTLHAVGYDHQTPEQALQMESLEKEILASMGISDPYSL